ncbi:hypothetical protein BH24ACT3_BH24ACT3_00660 [soil metagenome]
MFVSDEGAEEANGTAGGSGGQEPTSPHAPPSEVAADRLEGEVAAACGSLNAASARLVGLIGEALVTGAWQVAGIRSVEHWVTWQCGVSPGRAYRLVMMARRWPELPVTAAAYTTGELAEDQVAVLCRHVPVHNDTEAATLARYASVPQLQHALGRYVFAPQPDEPAGEQDEPAGPVPTPAPVPVEKRTVGFGYGEDGTFRLTALLPPDEGAVIEAALVAARQSLFG